MDCDSDDEVWIFQWLSAREITYKAIRDDLFKINAGIVRDLATGIATAAPKAFVLVISNPVNSTVPIVVEVFKKHGVFDAKKFANRCR